MPSTTRQPRSDRERAVPDLLRRMRAAACRGRSSNCGEVPFMSTYGFGPAVERWGGFLSDLVDVPVCRAHAGGASRGPRTRPRSPARRTTSPTPGAPSDPLWSASPAASVLVVGGAAAGSIGVYAAGIARRARLRVGALRRRRRGPARDGRSAGRANDGRERRSGSDHSRSRSTPARDPDGLALALRSTAPDGDLHELRDLLRRAALDAAAGDVHEGDHLPYRPCQRTRGDAARARRSPPPASFQPELVTSTVVAWADASGSAGRRGLDQARHRALSRPAAVCAGRPTARARCSAGGSLGL